MENVFGLSAAQLRQAADIKENIDRLSQKLAGILDGEIGNARSVSGGEIGKGRRRGRPPGRGGMSAEGRARIAAAAKPRWAKIRGNTAAPETNAVGVKKKRKMSPEGRARIAAAVKARWAREKAAKG